MLASLALAVALSTPSAPIRPETQPAGPAPYVLELKAGQDGKIRLNVIRNEKIKPGANGGGADIIIGVGNARPLPAPVPQPAPADPNTPDGEAKEITVQRMVQVEFGDLKDLVISTADGKDVSKADAMKKLTDGAVVIASADGKKVDPKFLKLFRDDTLVLMSPDFINFPGQGGGRLGRPIMRPLPAVIGGGVAPAILPAQPVPAPVDTPAVEPAEKPAVKPAVLPRNKVAPVQK
jgi:hypothetical protein